MVQFARAHDVAGNCGQRTNDIADHNLLIPSVPSLTHG